VQPYDSTVQIPALDPVAPATVGAAAEAGRYAVVEIGAVEGVAILKPVYRVDLLTRNAIPPDFE
jgi:hypothetical protein